MHFSKNSMKYWWQTPHNKRETKRNVSDVIMVSNPVKYWMQSLQKRSSQVFPCCGDNVCKCLQEMNNKNKLRKSWPYMTRAEMNSSLKDKTVVHHLLRQRC